MKENSMRVGVLEGAEAAIVVSVRGTKIDELNRFFPSKAPCGRAQAAQCRYREEQGSTSLQELAIQGNTSGCT
jgi:hypothetical protein